MWPCLLITDCTSVFDALHKQRTSSSRCSKRTSIDLAIIREALSRDVSHARWADTRAQLVDNMTKNTAKAEWIKHVMRTGRYVVVEEAEAFQLKTSQKSRKVLLVVCRVLRQAMAIRISRRLCSTLR